LCSGLAPHVTHEVIWNRQRAGVFAIRHQGSRFVGGKTCDQRTHRFRIGEIAHSCRLGTSHHPLEAGSQIIITQFLDMARELFRASWYPHLHSAPRADARGALRLGWMQTDACDHFLCYRPVSSNVMVCRGTARIVNRYPPLRDRSRSVVGRIIRSKNWHPVGESADHAVRSCQAATTADTYDVILLGLDLKPSGQPIRQMFGRPCRNRCRAAHLLPARERFRAIERPLLKRGVVYEVMDQIL